MTPLTGRRQSPEHIAKRVAAVAATLATWTEERRILFRQRVSLSNRAGEAEIRRRNSEAHKGRRPHNYDKVGVWCAICRTGFLINRYRLKRTQRFYCSQKHKAEGQKQFGNPKAKRGTEHQCAICSATVWRKPTALRGVVFCSLKCKGAYFRSDQVAKAMSRRITNGVYKSLKVMGLRKDYRKWQSLVGYTTQDLAAHLESLFQSGMGWHNMGAWHIDHIKPRAAFTFSSYNDPAFKECWALSNLQPLWAKDNIRKGARLTAAA
jgi:hypothetical protein